MKLFVYVQPPLVVLAAGSLSDSHCGHGPQQPVRKYVETGHVWKRTVDSVLVVGMLVQNVSKRLVKHSLDRSELVFRF